MSTSANAVDRLASVIASFGLCGFFPIAPATFASAVTAVLLWWVYPLPSAWQYVVLLSVLLLVGTWSSGRSERLYGHDPSMAVIDEVLGMAITMLAAPISVATLVLGFVFFRVFDVLKVWPGRAMERLPAGWGVMMDDVMAGVYAWVSLQIVLRFWPEPHLATWHWIAGGVASAVLFAFRKPLLRRYGKKRSHISKAFGSSDS